MSTDRFGERLRNVVGPTGLLSDPEQMRGYLTDWRGANRGRAALVVRPAATEEVAAVVRLCREAGVALVPQGGNTGLCGGAVPDGSGRQVVLSLTRMSRIRRLDRDDLSVTVDAGVVLRTLQEAARAVDCVFPLSLGSEGSATIGGLLATNAGGIAVLRYGTMRELALGLEVVLPDGRVWHGLRRLRKDNTGYPLEQLFLGAEGTLGVITAAVLRLFPAARNRATACAALPDPRAAVDLLRLCQARAGARLTGFELMSRQSVDFVRRHQPGARDPFPAVHPWYGLVELTDQLPDAHLDDLLTECLAKAMERGLLRDGVVAASSAQAASLWALREGVSEAQNHEGPSLKHDVSVPVSAIPAFVQHADEALHAALPGIRIVSYGHVGDGNLHYNLSKPAGTDDAEFTARADALARVVYDAVARFDGSISAEHGLGQAKRAIIADYKDPVALDLMRDIKGLLDPAGLMNPGKVLPDPPDK